MANIRCGDCRDALLWSLQLLPGFRGGTLREVKLCKKYDGKGRRGSRKTRRRRWRRKQGQEVGAAAAAAKGPLQPAGEHQELELD